MEIIQGKAIFGGIAIGPISFFAKEQKQVKRTKVEDTEAEIGRIAPSVKFGNEDFMKDINKVVAEMRDEGVLDQIYEKYGLDPKLHAITNDQKDNGLNK